MIRAIIQSAVEGVIKRFTASARVNETIEDREYMQHYGFTSMPQPGAEGVVIHEGNHYIMVATDDRRYRIPVVAGEVCIYTDEGDSIHFERGKNIVITTGNQVTINAVNSVTVNAPEVSIEAAIECEISTPLLNLSGDRSGLRTLVDDRLLAIFNGHTHPDPEGGNTGVPNQQLSEGNTCTTKVMGA